MTYVEVMKNIPPRLIRNKNASSYLGARKLLQLMEGHHWIKPIIAEHRMKLYDVRVLDRCIDRLATGEFPGRAPKKT